MITLCIRDKCQNLMNWLVLFSDRYYGAKPEDSEIQL